MNRLNAKVGTCPHCVGRDFAESVIIPDVLRNPLLLWLPVVISAPPEFNPVEGMYFVGGVRERMAEFKAASRTCN